MPDTEAAAHVQLGAAFLDEHDPGWWRTDPPKGEPINLDTLALDSDCECILGQRCPLELRDPIVSPYMAYAYELRPIAERAEMVPRWHVFAAMHGFALPPLPSGEMWYERAAQWDELTTAWRDIIKTRREEKP
jgi:hypothetical protein